LLYRICSACNIEKPLLDFNKDKCKPLGYKTYCKICHRKQSKKYSINNVEIYRNRAKNWYVANKDKKREYDKKYRKIYYKREAIKLNASVNARRRKVRNSKPKWANDFFIKEIYELTSMRKKMTGIAWTVDHIVPIRSPIVCGLHCEFNLQILTLSENISKGNRHWPDMPT